MEFKLVKIDAVEGVNTILGTSHFIKTVEDLYEAMTNSGTHIKFGIGFCESSGPCLVRHEGNDEELRRMASENAMRLGCGHAFIIHMKDAFPINVLNRIKEVAEVCTIHAATANPLEVVVVETGQGRGILGVVDGFRSKGIENEGDIEERKEFLRRIGYKR